MDRVDPLNTLPWSTERHFQVRQYRISHKTLIFRHGWQQGEPAYEIEFTGVVWMELATSYDGLTITALREYGQFNDQHPMPLLVLDLRDRRQRRGVVVCSRIALVEVEAWGGPGGKREGLSGLVASRTELSVGGVPVEPEDVNYRGMLRKYRRATEEERAAGLF